MSSPAAESVRPSAILAVLLGAKEWPSYPGLDPSEAFVNSASRFKSYLTAGLGLPAPNILDLFNDPRTAPEILVDLGSWLRGRVAEFRENRAPATDLIVYFVGHGAFIGAQRSYHLCIRFTNEAVAAATSLRAHDLAVTLRESARHIRQYLILDACFAAGTVDAFQGPRSSAIREDTLRSFPHQGVALLCSSSRWERSVAPRDDECTMFSAALLDVLEQGEPTLGERLSLRDIGDITRDRILERHQDAPVRPEVHSPEQQEGDVAEIPLFPNPAAIDVRRWRHEQAASQTVERLRGTRRASSTRRPRSSNAWVRRAALVAAIPLFAAVVILAATRRTPMSWVIDAVGLAGPPVNPPIPDRPSIVVLPFVNAGGDPDQEYFADAIADDLTTGLARSSGLFVISRSSAYTYKDHPVAIDQIGRELGVRYVIEGNVRKLHGRISVTARLVDSATGNTLWNERYDRGSKELFDLQSSLIEEILVAIAPRINSEELRRSRRKSTTDLTAYDAFIRGVFEFNRFTREGFENSRPWFERAIQLDPQYADAHAMLGATYGLAYTFGWDLDPTLQDRAETLAKRALELDPTVPSGYLTLAGVYLFRNRTAEAVEAAERAVELHPNLSVSHSLLAAGLARQGHYLRALQEVKRALRLDPRAPSGVWVLLAVANRAAGRGDEARAMLERARASNPDMILARIPLAYDLEQEANHAGAQVIVEEILRVNPSMTAEIATRLMLQGPGAQWNRPQDAIAVLKRAGLP